MRKYSELSHSSAVGVYALKSKVNLVHFKGKKELHSC